MDEPDPSTPIVIEVGASAADGSLRYWRAKEAVRQAELRYGAQAAIRTALEARATAITGWAAASLLAIAAAGAASAGWPPRIAAAAAGAVLFVAAATCIHAARPREWAIVGYDPRVITNDALETELEVLESIAGGLSPGIQANNKRLTSLGASLRWAGWMLIGAPIAGALTYVVLNATAPWSA